MKKTILDHTGTVLAEYQGIIEITIMSANVLAMSDKDSNRILAIVKNEDMLDYWLLDPLNPQGALNELYRYYSEEESWLDLNRPGAVQVFNMQAISISR